MRHGGFQADVLPYQRLKNPYPSSAGHLQRSGLKPAVSVPGP
jgi:hypothetical protein